MFIGGTLRYALLSTETSFLSVSSKSESTSDTVVVGSPEDTYSGSGRMSFRCFTGRDGGSVGRFFGRARMDVPGSGTDGNCLVVIHKQLRDTSVTRWGCDATDPKISFRRLLIESYR